MYIYFNISYRSQLRRLIDSQPPVQRQHEALPAAQDQVPPVVQEEALPVVQGAALQANQVSAPAVPQMLIPRNLNALYQADQVLQGASSFSTPARQGPQGCHHSPNGLEKFERFIHGNGMKDNYHIDAFMSLLDKLEDNGKVPIVIAQGRGNATARTEWFRANHQSLFAPDGPFRNFQVVSHTKLSGAIPAVIKLAKKLRNSRPLPPWVSRVMDYLAPPRHDPQFLLKIQ